MNIKKIPLHKYEDERGWLVENENKEIKDAMKHFVISTTKPGHVRGQHYHKKKKEWFLILKGEARFVFKDMKTHKTQEVFASGKTPEIIIAIPNIAHSIENIGNQELMLLAIVNEPLDKNHPDTYPFKVI